MTQSQLKIYQAPLQGHTDFTFRHVFSEVFGGIDKYFIPYLSYGKGRELKKSALKEVFPENNLAQPVVPQVLFSDVEELFDLVTVLVNFGYQEINLNLGCPYPMATNKGRGAAWLSKPDVLKNTLQELYAKGFPVKYSVKMRAGMKNDQEAKAVFEVLNQFQLEEIIFHARTADQMYEGKAEKQWFTEALLAVKHPLVYNGDIFSVADFQELKVILPVQNSFMLGRGLLMNPSLPLTLKGETPENRELKLKMKEFHDGILQAYSARLDGAGHILMKMNQFWSYFSESFENPHKVMKLVKKSGNMLKYNAAVVEIFRNYWV